MNVFTSALAEREGQNIPVRISMTSGRRESGARLFDAVFGDDGESTSSLTRLTPDEEAFMGISHEEDDETNDTNDTTDGEERLDLITEGILVCHADPESGAATVTISYPESELTGMEGSQSSVVFRTDEPGLIHMIRTGTVNTALTFREHCRAVCTYDTPYMPFQVCIHGIRVDNRLLTDGILLLDYVIEIRGAQAEHCSMEMRVEEQEI